MWITPVYDRTYSDVLLKNRKSYINARDLNRIEGNMSHLAGLLHCDIEVKTWQKGEFIFLSDIKRIEKNLQAISNAYMSTAKMPQVPSIPFVVYSQWNDIEKIIYEIYSLFCANKKAVSFCGEIYSGSQIGVI